MGSPDDALTLLDSHALAPSRSWACTSPKFQITNDSAPGPKGTSSSSSLEAAAEGVRTCSFDQRRLGDGGMTTAQQAHGTRSAVAAQSHRGSEAFLATARSRSHKRAWRPSQGTPGQKCTSSCDISAQPHAESTLSPSRLSASSRL